MSALESCSYTGTADLRAMIELTRRLRAGGQTVYPIAADLYEELADPKVQITARLWEKESGQLVGFVYVSQYQNLVDVFAANELTPALETEMIDWAAGAVRRRNQESGERQTLDASALESDLPRLQFLERHGFVRQAESSILMARSLDEPIPNPALPPGFAIRPMGGESEVEAYVALHRAAFGTENMTVEYRRTIMSAPDFIPELDLVAVAPDGELAAFCVCQIFPDDAPRAGGQKEGWTDPMGTHPAYQRKGLAKALMLHGMGLLKARGMDTAILGTSSQNTAMQRTAEAVGFQRASNTLWYCKVV
ncbi:MAG: GNAT family N-acetyltransferase [Anaerolineales bacterium]|nr:GNAT family N-acetyltransferase [Anaerolineales bacterium]